MNFLHELKTVSSDYHLTIPGLIKTSTINPEINSIQLYLRFSKLKNNKNILTLLFLLKILSQKQPRPNFIRKKKLNIKLKQDFILNCRVTLFSRHEIYTFLEHFIYASLRFKNTQRLFVNKQSTISTFTNILNFFDISSEYNRFYNVKINLSMSIQTKPTGLKTAFMLLSNLNLPVKVS